MHKGLRTLSPQDLDVLTAEVESTQCRSRASDSTHPCWGILNIVTETYESYPFRVEIKGSHMRILMYSKRRRQS